MALSNIVSYGSVLIRWIAPAAVIKEKGCMMRFMQAFSNNE